VSDAPEVVRLVARRVLKLDCRHADAAHQSASLQKAFACEDRGHRFFDSRRLTSESSMIPQSYRVVRL